jgi:hypothetical protein
MSVEARTSEARASEAKAKAEDLPSEANDRLTWPRGQVRGLEDYISDLQCSLHTCGRQPDLQLL